MKTLQILLLALLCCACKKEPQPTQVNGNTMPEQIRFVLTDMQGSSLLTSTATPLTVFFYGLGNSYFSLGSECSGGGCTMIREFPPGPRRPFNFYYSSLEAAIISSQGTKTWYLRLNGKTDTLYYDVQRTRPNDPLDQFDVVSVKFNGQPVQLDPTQPLPVYVFQRKR